MIQRLQSLFFIFSAICSITIIYNFPVLQNDSTSFFLKDNFSYSRLCILLSASLSIFAIFQFKNRKRQQLLASFARLMITIAFFLIIFLHKKDNILDRNDSKKVLDMIERLKEKGVSVLIISHNLEHVFSIADRISVLKNGRMIGTVSPKNVNRSDVVKMITTGEGVGSEGATQ